MNDFHLVVQRPCPYVSRHLSVRSHVNEKPEFSKISTCGRKTKTESKIFVSIKKYPDTCTCGRGPWLSQLLQVNLCLQYLSFPLFDLLFLTSQVTSPSKFKQKKYQQTNFDILKFTLGSEAWRNKTKKCIVNR